MIRIVHTQPVSKHEVAALLTDYTVIVACGSGIKGKDEITVRPGNGFTGQSRWGAEPILVCLTANPQDALTEAVDLLNAAP